MLILVVQSAISPPPEKLLAQIHLCVNGKMAVFTPSTKLTLRIPKCTNSSAVSAVGDSAQVSVRKSNSDDGRDNVELEVMVEADNKHASNGEDGLACCACKQAAGVLEMYEEDGQQLPGDEHYQSKGDEDELTSEDIDIMHDAEQFADQQDEVVSDPEEESNNDDTSNESSEEDDENDVDFVPQLKLKGKGKSKVFKAMGGKKRARKVERDANYTFCPLPH